MSRIRLPKTPMNRPGFLRRAVKRNHLCSCAAAHSEGRAAMVDGAS